MELPRSGELHKIRDLILDDARNEVRSLADRFLVARVPRAGPHFQYRTARFSMSGSGWGEFSTAIDFVGTIPIAPIVAEILNADRSREIHIRGTEF